MFCLVIYSKCGSVLASPDSISWPSYILKALFCCHSKCLRSLILNLRELLRRVRLRHINRVRPGNVHGTNSHAVMTSRVAGSWLPPCLQLRHGFDELSAMPCGCVCPWHFKKEVFSETLCLSGLGKPFPSCCGELFAWHELVS